MTGSVVLIVDDDEAILDYVSYALENAGYTVFTAKNGKECVSLFEKHKPSVILTDIVMPEAEGIETIRKILKSHPECKIIAMSGAMNSGTYLSIASSLGAQAVLQKPFDREVVLETVYSILNTPSVL